ncbi:MAG: FHA domain-containing protein [Planctomycetota bacterium]
MPSLIVLEGPNKGDYYPVTQDQVTVGRLSDCTIQLVDDAVSRRHCTLRFDRNEGRYQLVDNASANGVTLNGERVAEQAFVDDGAKIALGDSTLYFTMREFPDRESALTDQHLKRWFGEEDRQTIG